ncbi:MAG: AttH component of AttEFGH ABC transport system [uncultured Thiotrichaceae bacterium]|uniref:AttH component of AttEFGH ABC transport system n=1 Tax=uncultured Thiotrichaceae bacterium TaxID=298394 RepID=A0A6S6SBU4_9GAMM|nr:MAG: AttH component of AttEFGH ABC transport system [uncultured Thiotrichaceae bacterium]
MIGSVFKTVLILCVLMLSACDHPSDDEFDLNAALGGVADSGFERAVNPREFQFPADHAAHPDFRNEWWYITGNVESDSGRHFGYQVTFFRIALTPSSDQPSSRSQWGTNQLWMAHVALTDSEGQQHLHDQRFARGAAGLAGQENKLFRVWLEDWQIVGSSDAQFPWAVTVKADGFSLNLQLSPEKPVVLQGDAGLSQKSGGVGNASYYYSLTRLATSGELYLGDQRFVVNGQSWMDREWSTSVLGDDQVGWDWFSLQLDSGHDVMLYQLRNAAGEADAYSAGKWVLPDGQSESMNMQHVEFKPLRKWCLAEGNADCYPVEWSIIAPEKNINWTVEAVVDDQLMQTGITYWEGAVNVTDTRTGKMLGRGYLEMSGY